MRASEVDMAIRAAHVPVARPGRLRIGVGPAYAAVGLSYYDYEEDVLCLRPGADRAELFHELGHVFDHKHLTTEDRLYLRRQLGGRWTRWFWGNWNPLTHRSEPYEEKFAWAYADAALHKRRRIRLRRFLEEVYAR